MDTTQQTNGLILFLEKLFTSSDSSVRKEAEIELNLFANSQNEVFFSLLIEIMSPKNPKGL